MESFIILHLADLFAHAMMYDYQVIMKTCP